MRPENLWAGKYELPPGHWLVIRQGEYFAVWWKTHTRKWRAVDRVECWETKVHHIVVGHLRYNTQAVVDMAVLVINNDRPINNAIIVPQPRR